MEINVDGASNKLENYTINAVEFVMSKFFNLDELEYISVEVNFTDDCDDEGGCAGDIDDGDFLIEVKKDLPMREKMITLMHELVHMKQHISLEMKYDISNDETTWQDKKFLNCYIDYWDRPWEIEAHGRQLGLFIRWVEDMGEGHHKKWRV
jgi:hypothetical protein